MRWLRCVARLFLEMEQQGRLVELPLKNGPSRFRRRLAPINGPVIDIDHAGQQRERRCGERLRAKLREIFAIRAGAVRLDQVAIFQAGKKLPPCGEPRAMPVAIANRAPDFLVVKFGRTKSLLARGAAGQLRFHPVPAAGQPEHDIEKSRDGKCHEEGHEERFKRRASGWRI